MELKSLKDGFAEISVPENEHIALSKLIKEYAHENPFAYAASLNREEMEEIVQVILESRSDEQGNLVFSLDKKTVKKTTRLLDEIRTDLRAHTNPDLDKTEEKERLEQGPFKTLIKLDEDMSTIYNEVLKVVR